MGYILYDLQLKTVSWIIVMVYLGILGIVVFRRMAKADKDLKSVRVLYRSLALIFYFYICNRIAFILSDFERDLHDTTAFHYQLVNIGYIFTELAFVNLLYYGEKFVVRKTKFILTITTISIILIQSILVFIPELFLIVRTLSYSLSYTLLGLIGILFIRLTAQSTGKLRRNFLITLIGLIVVATSGILETDALLSTGRIPPFLTPMLMAIGATIITLGMRYV